MMKKNVMSILMLSASIAFQVAYAIDDKCAEPLSKEQLADHWIACEGSGKDRNSAIENAVKEGLSMVYGQVMSAEDKAESHISEAQVKTSGSNETTEVSMESMASKIEIKTAGFVREYKVIYVVNGDGEVKAHVHARIINPRSGIDAVILVTKPEATTELKAELIKVGPSKTISGKEICNVAESALCNALSGSKHFRVCTSDALNATVANNKLTDSLVGAGMVPSSELLHAGKMLTCDYVLSTRLQKVSYSKRLGQNKKTKKFGQIQSMKVIIDLQLTDIRTGTSAASNTVTLTLDNDEIKELIAQDEDADLLKGAFNCLVKPLREWVKKKVK